LAALYKPDGGLSAARSCAGLQDAARLAVFAREPEAQQVVLRWSEPALAVQLELAEHSEWQFAAAQRESHLQAE
jgi:hypothetical protein